MINYKFLQKTAHAKTVCGESNYGSNNFQRSLFAYRNRYRIPVIPVKFSTARIRFLFDRMNNLHTDE